MADVPEKTHTPHSSRPRQITSSADRASRTPTYLRRKIVDESIEMYDSEVKKQRLEQIDASSSATQYDPKIGMISKKNQAGKALFRLTRTHRAVQFNPRTESKETQAGDSFVWVEMVSTSVQTDDVTIVGDCHKIDDELEEEVKTPVKTRKDDERDQDYRPPIAAASSDESSYDSEDENISTFNGVTKSNEEMLAEPKYIVFESQLLQLFRLCPNCRAFCNIEKKTPRCFGSQLSIKQECTLCEYQYTWYSQPKLGSMWAGNILLSASILFAGASPAMALRIMEHMNLRAISYGTFMDHQSKYMQPAIVRTYKFEQNLINQSIGQRAITIGGDARCDSPGHSAKYGSYTLMDMDTCKVIDVQLVQSNETTSSNAMELEGLKRGLQHLRENNIHISTLVSDRHRSVNAYIRDKEKDITHYYDVWHVSKGLKKQLTRAAKIKGCELIGEWKHSISNQLYWCASSTPDGNPDVMEGKFTAILNHVKDVHDGHGQHFNTCEHGELEPRAWIPEDTKAYDKLSSILKKKTVIKDVRKLSPMKQTSKVESYHAVIIYFCPKMTCFSYAGMKTRLYLATLHWNENGNRQQATTRDGRKKFSILYPKQKEGDHVVKRVLVKCTYNYVKALMKETFAMVGRGERQARQMIADLESPEFLCSQYDHPDKQEAIAEQQAHGRFVT